MDTVCSDDGRHTTATAPEMGDPGRENMLPGPPSLTASSLIWAFRFVNLTRISPSGTNKRGTWLCYVYESRRRSASLAFVFAQSSCPSFKPTNWALRPPPFLLGGKGWYALGRLRVVLPERDHVRPYSFGCLKGDDRTNGRPVALGS